ncbi:MAG: DUF5615 family PIN-like protein [Pirellulales bacterium]
MTLALYMDHQVQRAIVEGLIGRGVDVITATDDGTATWTDEELLTRATQLGRVVFTRDEDFLKLAATWLADGRDFAGVVYSHQQKIDIGGAVRDLELIAKVLTAEEIRSRVLFLPL